MDKLYELAYEYRKTKLWKKISEDQFFAIKLNDDKIGFINIMGAGNEYNAINLTIGEDNLLNFKKVIESNMDYSNYDYFVSTLLLENHQLIFGNKDDLDPGEVKEVRKFKKEHGIKITGSLTFPYFRKSVKFSPLTQFDNEKDYSYIKQAISASIDLSKILGYSNTEDLNIYSIYDEPSIMALENDGESYKIKDSLNVDWNKEISYPIANIININILKNIKKAKKSGQMECQLVILPEPVEDSEFVPHYPQILLAVDKRSGEAISTNPVEDYTKNPNEIVNSFFEMLVNLDRIPEVINVADKRTFNLLKEICANSKINLSIKDNLMELEEVKNHFFDYLDSQMAYDADNSDVISDEEILQMLEMMEYMANEGVFPPQELIELLVDGVETGVFDDNLSKKIIETLDKIL
ncbi:DUF6930 domain-containing protein [Anaerococcus provencensis]|uniref:DUF6930 domain-containing protein n=1 Tax=Anaerococcus provencensis TaxID=938293 RepID=UPI0002FA6834|nr:hypothetical protein [Anaerococcus provencensis]